MTGAVNSYVMQSGSGTLTLSGAADNVNARAIVSSGTLVLGKTSTAAIHAATAANDIALVVNGGTLDLNGLSEGFDALGGSAGGIIPTGIVGESTLTLGESG